MRSKTSLVPFEVCALLLVLTACGGGEPDGAAARVGASTDAGGPLTNGPPDASFAPPADASPPPGTPVDASAPADAGSACASGFPAVTDFGAKGPFATTKDDAATIASLQSASCTVYRPTTLGGDTGHLQHPIVIWGNGTGTPTELVYEWLFTQWASHGFIVAAANTPNAGTGVEMLRCLDWVQAQSTTAGSPYQGHVATELVAASGHSQGGGGAIMAGEDPRVTLTVPFMAYTQGLGYEAGAAPAQHGPMLLMSGGADTIAPPAQNQLPVFQETTVPTFWGTLAGADHVTFALGGEAGYLAPSTAWLRLFFMCDESARPMFYGASCTLCTESNWTVQRKGM